MLKTCLRPVSYTHLSVVLSAQSTDGEDVTKEDMEKSRAIIESRVNALGASEATVQVQGNDQILVQIPGLSDPETALATIGKTGKLEFARADSFTEADDQAAIKNGTYMPVSYTHLLGADHSCAFGNAAKSFA